MALAAAPGAGTPGLRGQRPIRLLIVDDSAVARAVFSRMIAARPEFEIVATVSSADAALAYLSGAWVDIILLDIEMPGMDGLTALPAVLAASNGARVLIVSSSAEEGAVATMRALTLGAADTLAKPGAGSFGGRFAEVLAERLIRIGHAKPPARTGHGLTDGVAEVPLAMRPLSRGPIACVAIGASTGGLHALSDLLRALPADFDAPILITQHLPPVFMSFFAAQIEEIAGRPAAVAAEGRRLRRGEILVAPGEGHLGVRLTSGRAAAHIVDGAADSGCMPSVDPMFESVAAAYGPAAVGIVLSGMGRDGVIGGRALADAGADLLVQNRDTAVVWGMPGAAAGAGLACAILPPAQIADTLARRARAAAGAA